MPNTLEHIHIKGFKSIRNLTFEMQPLNVLIGANGAGKSNFIALFRLLNELIESRLQTYTAKQGAESLLYYGAKITDYIEIELVFGRNGYRATLTPTTQGTLIFANESCWFQGDGDDRPYMVNLGSGHKETQLFAESSSTPQQTAADYIIGALRDWKIYHFHDTSEAAPIKQTHKLHDNERLRPDAANLAAFLYYLQAQHTQAYRRIVKTIRQVAPFFDDFNLRPSPLNPDMIRLAWRERDSDAYFDAHMLSDGTLRFMCLATLLLQPTLPSLILIDEPELGLHPYAIALLADLLEVAATKTQVILSTQSVPLINQFAPESIIVVDRKGNQSTFERLDEQALNMWLTEYGIGDLWEKNLIGGRPQNPEVTYPL